MTRFRGTGLRLFVSVVLGVVLASVSVANGHPSTAANPKASIRLVAQDAWVGPNGRVTTTLELHDVAAGATLVPVVYGVVPTRSAFALNAGGDNLPGPARPLREQPLTKGDRRVTVRFTVTDGLTPAGGDATNPNDEDTVVWAGPGVHPIVFTLRDASGATLDTVVTFVVRLAARPATGEPSQRPLLVGTEVRLEAPPSTDPDGVTTVTADSRRRAAALIAGIADPDDGSVAPQGFGFAITPELLDAIGQSHSRVDRSLLAKLDVLTTDRPLQRLPWVTIDLGRWLATPDLAPRTDRLISDGGETLTRFLHAPDASVADLPAWGAHPTIAAIDWLADHGATGALIPEDALEPLDASAFPRSLAAPFSLAIGNGRTITAMQIDRALSAHFTSTDPVLGANLLIADLAVMALDLPAIQRGVVVAPPPNWPLSSAFLEAYRADLAGASPPGAVPLLQPTSPNDVLSTVPEARASGDLATTGAPLVRALRQTTTPVPLDALAADLDRTQAKVVSLATMIPGGPSHSASLTRLLTRRVNTAASAALNARERARRLSIVRTEVDDVVATVRMPPTQTITLTSNTADLPFTVHRGPDGPTAIRLHFEANTRLEFAGGSSQLIHLSDTTNQLRIRIHSDAPGDSVVQVTATSPNGTLLVGNTKLVVRSTAASGMGVFISFGSLAFLLVWWIRDIIRVRRRRREDRVRPADLIDV